MTTTDRTGTSRIRQAVDQARSVGVLRLGVLGPLVLVISGFGFPLTQLVIARFGRRGAAAAEAVSAGLLARDVMLVSTGVPRRLRWAPAALLWLEVGAAAMSTLAGLGALRRPGQSLNRTPAGIVEALRRACVGVMFGTHTYRYWMWLQPDRGLKPR